MACGGTLTLKRSLEFDPVHSGPGSTDHHHHRLPKRRRLLPPTVSRAAAPTKQHQINPSPFLGVVPKLTDAEFAEQLSAQIRRIQQRRHLFASSSSPSSPTSFSPRSSPSPSSFTSSATLHETTSCVMPSSSSCDVSTSLGNLSVGENVHRKDMPLFTFKQVGLVCERMMKEREAELQEEYDKVLAAKLSEQYEAFLKFNQDQLHRKYGESAASYVS